MMRTTRLWMVLFLFGVACGGQRRTQTGMASWYGPGFRGKKTASGERFWPIKKTAAHKTLPFGTVVKVTRLDTGQSVRVVINDRGPYAHGRIIDLSRRAARKIDMVQSGTARVRVKVVGCKTRYDGC
jgi:rare lipoprotein A